jgi:putative membrane protein
MTMAGQGALIAMSVILLIRARYDRGLWRELRDSVRIRPGDAPLGEVELRELIRSSRREGTRGALTSGLAG